MSYLANKEEFKYYLTLYKMGFLDTLRLLGLSEEEIESLGDDRILISLVRHTLPNLIAQDIIGVQPMTGPVGQIHTLRTRYDR